MNRQDVLYTLKWCPAIFDYGAEGIPGAAHSKPAPAAAAQSESYAPCPPTSDQYGHGSSDHQSRAAAATAVDSPGSGDTVQAPSVSISLDGTQVYKAPLGENLCIPTKAIEQVVDHLLAYGKYSHPQGRGDTQEQIGSICLSIQRDNERKQAHILFPQAKRGQHTHLIEFRQSASDKTREQIDRHTAIPSRHLDNEAL